ncbi:oxidoreductase [Thelonectria olida]|uniref:Oxidoreductase n=1 Tax=Thelonectria olida TaxID=1576542 RepID=A0A9P8W6J9_9HYPO|nr:oxidoreductase [Thelonectria olida]
MTNGKYNYNKLAGKNVLVIGGTSGIGFAVAKAALAFSANVTISSSSAERIALTIQKLKEEFPDSQVQGYPCNLATEAVEQEIERLFSQIPGGSVDHIVYTAGDKVPIMSLKDVTREKIVAGGQMRFVAPILVAKIGSQHLTPGPESSITLTSGTVWEHPVSDWTVVAGYMGGVCSVARNLALDLKPIRVNAVSPGLVDTELWDAVIPADKKQGLLDHEAFKHPTGRVAKAEDIAEAYVYLMKDANITGRIISTDSGSLLV